MLLRIGKEKKMNKFLKKDIKIYIRKVSKLIKADFSIKRIVLKDLKNNIKEYYLDNNNITIQDIYERFGSPKEISLTFEKIPSEELIKKAKLYKTIFISCVIFLCVSIYILITIYLNSIDKIIIRG